MDRFRLETIGSETGRRWPDPSGRRLSFLRPSAGVRAAAKARDRHDDAVENNPRKKVLDSVTLPGYGCAMLDDCASGP